MSDAMDVESLRSPYSQQQVWADVSPLDVDDGNRVVAVQYTPEHREALSYFRAVLASGEKSDRALQLAADMIRLNQADYTAWQLRWLCVEALDRDLEAEYKLTEDIMLDNAKNYQLWNHRRKCALRAGPLAAPRELEFSSEALEVDAKNYHAWAHRMAIVQAFGLWHTELDDSEEMLSRDLRNNSAWNQRAFVLKSMLQAGVATPSPTSSPDQADLLKAGARAADASCAGGDTQAMDKSGGAAESVRRDSRGALEDVIRQEIKFVASKIELAPRNESCWNYLLGMFTLPGCRKHELACWPQVHAVCLAALGKVPSCSPALAALMEYYTAVAEASASHALVMSMDGAGEMLLEAAVAAVRAAVGHATALLEGLMQADPIRCLYWTHRQRALQQLLPVAGPDNTMQA